MPISTLAVPVFGVIGIASAVIALRSPSHVPDETRATRAGLAIVVGVSLVAWRTSWLEIPVADNLGAAVWSAAAVLQVALLTGRLVRRLGRSAVVGSVIISIVATSVVGIRLIAAVQDDVITTDVILMHESAFQVLTETRNPYEFATAVNSDASAPTAELLVGYVYPPISMAPMVTSRWLLGDPRWVLLLSWLGFLGIVGWRVARDHPNLQPIVPILSLFLPLRMTLFAGWTEPITLILASVVLLGDANRATWLRLLGLSAAATSKQHFAFAAPLLLSTRFTQKIRFVLSASLLAGLTFLPYLLIGWRPLRQALIGNLPPHRVRGDSYSIPTALHDFGFSFGLLPRPLWLVLVAIASFTVGRVVRSIGQLLMGTALVLAIAYILSQGFVNYWLLVASLCALGAVVMEAEAVEKPDILMT